MTDQTGTETTEDTASQTSEADATPPDTAIPAEAGESDNDDYQGNDPKIARAFKDAKRYRLQLRDTETERDQLATTLDGYHRAEAERLAGQHLADPRDLWRDGATVTDLLGDNGRINPDSVKDLVHGVLDAHPHWRKDSGKRVNSKDLKSGATSGADTRAVGWSQALRGSGNA
ncbi:hypothetical protein A8M60_07565 [Nocardia farcinica]|nr:hypothetical protein A8M60_07565 [Nocardia farcinica]